MRIAGTGHRPEKVGGYSDDAELRLRTLARDWLQPQRGLEWVISGMALGWDMALAEAALDLRIPLCAAIQFRGQECKWPKQSQERYRLILAHASYVHVVCDDGYASWKMQTRNEWMVDKCTRLLTLWDGSSGGTGNCVNYAIRVGLDYTNLWEDYKRILER